MKKLLVILLVVLLVGCTSPAPSPEPPEPEPEEEEQPSKYPDGIVFDEDRLDAVLEYENMDISITQVMESINGCLQDCNLLPTSIQVDELEILDGVYQYTYKCANYQADETEDREKTIRFTAVGKPESLKWISLGVRISHSSALQIEEMALLHSTLLTDLLPGWDGAEWFIDNLSEGSLTKLVRIETDEGPQYYHIAKGLSQVDEAEHFLGIRSAN